MRTRNVLVGSICPLLLALLLSACAKGPESETTVLQDTTGPVRHRFGHKTHDPAHHGAYDAAHDGAHGAPYGEGDPLHRQQK